MEDGKQNADNSHETSGPHKHDATKTKMLPRQRDRFEPLSGTHWTVGNYEGKEQDSRTTVK